MNDVTEPRTEREMAENYARMLGYDPAEVLVPVTAIDRDALIEAAARAAHGAHFPWSSPDREELRIEAAGVAASLPVIAAGLLAPLRELHHSKTYVCTHLRTPGELGPCCRNEICDACNQMHPCPTVRLLDQIEADCKGGE